MLFKVYIVCVCVCVCVCISWNIKEILLSYNFLFGLYVCKNLVFGINPLNAELNPICHLLALLGVHHFLHVSRIMVKSLTLRLLTC